MSMSFFRLMQLHQSLADRISLEQKRRFPDLFLVQRLKRLKLSVKDRLARRSMARQSVFAR